MGKLGGKARKFAKKNLQSVLKRKRKMKATFKRKSHSHRRDAAKKSDHLIKEQQKISSEEIKRESTVQGNYFDDLLSEDDESYLEDHSESDGYLSEDSDCPYIIEEVNEKRDAGKDSHVGFLEQNEQIRMELAMQKTKLDGLLEKDPKFVEFLETRIADLEPSRAEEIYSDEDDLDHMSKDDFSEQHDKKVVTSTTIDVWCWLVMEDPNSRALSNLLNSFRTACQYGIDSDECPQRIPNKKVFSQILTFVLSEADGIFRRRLGISDFCNQERILNLKNTASWENVRPLLKSYLRSCLLLLNQVTDSQILVFLLQRLKASIIFFAAFPSLIGRLMKILTHLWVTGEESLSLSSFLMVCAISSQLGSDCLDKCLSKTYKAFVAHCKFIQPTNLKHLEFLTDCLVEIYSLDIQRSYQKVHLHLQHLANILRQAHRTKKKEELKKIYSWQYMNCINLWVKFITRNIRDHDLQPLNSFLAEVIIGIANLFSGPRYLPLRFKCVHMLNKLSSASRILIPIASLLFDCLEYEGSNADTIRGKPFSVASVLKVPKQILKTRSFYEECIHSAIELLLAHFSQWSYHISFPEVATIPLILLKRFHERTTLESLRRSVKRLVDQVEQNMVLIQRKRDEVGFSPKDQASVESFLQSEKAGSNASFTQYYSSMLQKSWLNQI